MKRWIVRAVMVAAVAGGACRGGEERRLATEGASERVSDLLYRQNLISDSAVNRKMNEYVLRVSRDGVPAEEVMPEFHRWLAAWAREHPDRVAAARLAPAPYPAGGR